MAHVERSNAWPHADTTDHGVSLTIDTVLTLCRIIIQSWLFGASVVSVMNWWSSEHAKHERRWIRLVLVSEQPVTPACLAASMHERSGRRIGEACGLRQKFVAP